MRGCMKRVYRLPFKSIRRRILPIETTRALGRLAFTPQRAFEYHGRKCRGLPLLIGPWISPPRYTLPVRLPVMGAQNIFVTLFTLEWHFWTLFVSSALYSSPRESVVRTVIAFAKSFLFDFVWRFNCWSRALVWYCLLSRVEFLKRS